jgi:hypothetical protein
MSAFFGGRAGVHIRRVLVPIVYCDFLSMYPTVNALMGLWDFIIARKIEVVEATTEVQSFLNTVDQDRLFDSKTWRKLPAFVQLEPAGDILPVRSAFDPDTKDWQIGVNFLHTGKEGPREALWYSLPDVAASVLLTGRIPKIMRALRLKAVGRQRGLKSVKFRGDIPIDPRTRDFFKTVVEQRKLLDQRTDLSEDEVKRRGGSLKVTANATSYGILAEMTRHELGERRKAWVTVYGVDDESFRCKVAAPETPGEYCFPPLAALITGAARLQLALLERCVTDLGGTYAMEDTDSMAIVATRDGGLIPCRGGPHVVGGREMIKALSWAQVRGIAGQFQDLNPYEPSAVDGSALEIEPDNFDPVTGEQREIYCFAISAKRYAFFMFDANGDPQILQKKVNNKDDGWSEHGLGHLLNPISPNSEDRGWIREVWLYLIRSAIGLKAEAPSWFDRPALTRMSVSSPAMRELFERINENKPYKKQIKPFNFLLTAHIAPDGYPIGVDRDHFHLFAPYESDRRKWENLTWVDRYSRKTWKASTLINRGTSTMARLQTYRDIIEKYAFRKEAKSADASGEVCGKKTVGLLQRRHIAVGKLTHIGKESNKLEDVQSGIVHDVDEVTTELVDPKRDEWTTVILPILREMPISLLMRESGLSRATIQAIRAGRRPYKKNMERLVALRFARGKT